LIDLKTAEKDKFNPGEWRGGGNGSGGGDRVEL